MVTQVRRPRKAKAPQEGQKYYGKVSVGGLLIPAVTDVLFSLVKQDAPPFREGNVGREDRQGVRALKLEDWSGGLGILHGSETVHATRTRSSEGLWSFQPGGLFLPPRLQAQAALTATDISGFNAANKRLHSVVFDTRYVAALGSQLYKDTSTSDHAAAVPATADGITDLVTALWTGMVGTTPAVFMGCDGTTDDIQYTTNPFASTVSWTKFVTLGNAADYISAGQYFPSLGGGYHVIVGRIGNDPTSANGLWYVSKDASLPATALQVVYKDTKDVEGSNTTVTTAATTCSAGGIGSRGDTNIPELSQSAHYSEAYWQGWSSPANIVSSNNTYATATATFIAQSEDNVFDPVNAPTNIKTDELVASGFDFSGVPKGAIITGILVEVEAKEGSGDAIYWDTVQLIAGGQRSLNMATQLEVPTSEAYVSFGSSTNRWGMSQLEGRDIQQGLAVAIAFAGYEGASSSDGNGVTQNSTVSVDHVRATLTYRIPGAQVKLASGGFTPGPWLSKPNTLVYIEPESDDETGITKARRLVFINLEYDVEGDRIVASVEYPATGIDNITGACVTTDGIVVIGDLSAAGLAKNCHLVKEDGTWEDMGFGAEQGYTENWGLVNLWPADGGFVAKAVLEGLTVQQDWLCKGAGKWFAISPRETIAAMPIRHSRGVVSTGLRRRYTFWPATTNTNVTRTYQPVDYDLSPLNDTEIKADLLSHTTPIWDAGGPEESKKALLTARIFSHDVSTTNTVKLEYSTDGTNFTTWGTFTAYGQKITLSTPVVFQGVMFRVTLDHTAGTSATPNGMDIVIEMATIWPPLRQYTVVFEPFSDAFTALYQSGPQAFFRELEEKVTSSPTLALITGGDRKWVKWDDFQSAYEAANISGSMSTPAPDTQATITFTEVAQ